MLVTLLSNPVVAALVAAIPSIAAGWFGYLRAVRLDKRAAESFQLDATGQIIDGLKALVVRLEREIARLERELRALKPKPAP